jgi:hypothetical protein
MSDLQNDLENARHSEVGLDEIVALLRRYKEQGVPRQEVYALLEVMRRNARDEGTEDRILEVADFVAGFCAAHMKVWDD